MIAAILLVLDRFREVQTNKKTTTATSSTTTFSPVNCFYRDLNTMMYTFQHW